MRRSEVKREGTRALCFILIYIISALSKHRLIHKHGHQYSQRPERQPRCDLLHHIEQSVQMIKHNQSRRSSVRTHASFSFHRDIHICSFIFIDFIITIRILHCLSVCAYRMHRRKEKQGSSILTTTWSRNRNV
jgi:glycyl-tRNA synthetase beta subunit